jgi:WD40 repeat protein
MRKIATQSRAATRTRISRSGIGSMMTPMIAALVIAAMWAAPAAADHTRFWRQSSYDEFQKGTAKGVSLRSDGELLLGPKFTAVADPNLAYLWELRSDSHGNMFAAGGSNAKVIRVDTAGKMSTVFDSTEMTAQTIALDKSDNLFVGTSPDGKVYKVTPGGQKTVFFDPKTKYIWALAFGPDGTLYVATGDTGQIFAVAPDGKGDLFYASDETHIRSLALDGKGNLIAGTEPNGWVMRIPLAPGKAADRKAFVLYETPKREITAIVPDSSGNLYVAAIGEKTRTTIIFPTATQQQQVTVTATTGGAPAAAVNAAGQQGQQLIPPTAFQPFPTLTSSSVYRIAADGSPSEIWTTPDDLVYAMTLSADGKPVVGIGNHGAVIEIEGDRIYTLLTKNESDQVTGLSRAANGKMYVATANPGRIFSLGPGLESEGSFESQTFDARIFSRWGRLTWWGNNAAGNANTGAAANNGVQFYVRAGNTTDPTKSWSQWSGPLNSGAVVDSPAARFVQWRAVLHGNNTPAPEVAWVDVAYLPKNVAPRINNIAMQDPGVRVTSFGAGQASGNAPQVSLRIPPSGQQTSAGSPQRPQGEAARFDAPMTGVAQKGYASVLWNAEDDNEDELTYAVYYRGENEKDWRLLKDKLEQKFYSWDTTSMPDGAYYLKVVASDVKSNSPGDALQAEREGERFVVDNTPPVVTEIAADTANPNAVTVRFRATDATSPVIRTQYSLDAGDWIPVRPTGDLSDSLDEHYVVSLQNVGPGAHTVSVRAYDQFENEAAGKVDFSVPGAKR